MIFLLDRKLKNKGKKTSKTGWTFLTIQRFVISLSYLACFRVEDGKVLEIGFSQIACNLQLLVNVVPCNIFKTH